MNVIWRLNGSLQVSVRRAIAKLIIASFCMCVFKIICLTFSIQTDETREHFRPRSRSLMRTSTCLGAANDGSTALLRLSIEKSKQTARSKRIVEGD